MKVIPIVLALCLGVVPVASTLANSISQIPKFKTVIPLADFKLTPTTPWPASTVETVITYDKAADIFTPYTNELTITSTEFNVTASVDIDLVLNGPANTKIPVEVMLDGKKLKTASQVIHPKSPLAQKYPLRIVPTGKKHPPGTYTGSFTLFFDGT